MKSSAKGLGKVFLFVLSVSLVVGVTTLVTIPAKAETQATKFDGYLADVLCATRGTALDGADMMKHPEEHSVACLKEPPCAASGFGILVKGKDDKYMFHKFDNKGNELALELIKNTKKQDKVSVEVTGQMADGVINVAAIVEK